MNQLGGGRYAPSLGMLIELFDFAMPPAVATTPDLKRQFPAAAAVAIFGNEAVSEILTALATKDRSFWFRRVSWSVLVECSGGAASARVTTPTEASTGSRTGSGRATGRSVLGGTTGGRDSSPPQPNATSAADASAPAAAWPSELTRRPWSCSGGCGRARRPSRCR